MRKAQREEILEMLQTLEEAHRQIRENISRNDASLAQTLLVQCQECAITMGNTIESVEGEGFVTVSYLEAYCDAVYASHEELSHNPQNANGSKIYKNLRKQLLWIENSVKSDIRVRREAVFLPYKASMWDSLESVWKAAEADPDCDAYVIPIPYYDKTPDGSLKQMHYEGDRYPDYVPITKYTEFDFGKHHPEVIFIHNPYDDCNFVTTVHPFFYSDKLKKCTDCLVYIPYFATSGGMSEAQALCPAYFNADYIVIQSEKYRKYYDSRIPDSKFLALGSPKFDSVIHKCQNPPEPPAGWKDKMQGRKVYFYNTSLNGMLDNTENFLKKMEYVFRTFKGREDVCLLWRPHPLMEATFDSMREQYKPLYDALKEQFIHEKIGIYDTTPDIENTIALSDVYIGDSASSVVSLFGVVGKPIFILNNSIHEKPQEDDWRGTVFAVPRGDGQNQYCILPGNKLYYSPNDDFRYEYFCDLSEFAGGGYYSGAVEYRNNVYVLPANAQNILVISQDKQVKKIELKREVERQGAFGGFWFWKDKIYLLPNQYPDLVVMDLINEEITYISGIRDFMFGQVNEERVCAARWIWRDKLHFLNPAGDKLLSIDIGTYKIEIKNVSFNRLMTGVAAKEVDCDTLWFVPYSGSVITRWNPQTGETKDYNVKVDGMTSIHRRYKTECDLHMLGSVGFCDDRLIISPNWGNKFVELDMSTGQVKEWIPPFEVSTQDKNGYWLNWGMGSFVLDLTDLSYRYFYVPERKIYDIDLKTKEAREVKVTFNKQEVCSHLSGFSKWSEWIQYIWAEDVFNTLEDLIDGNIQGNQFDKRKQLQAYAEINASVNGDCGEKVYRYVMENMS